MTHCTGVEASVGLRYIGLTCPTCQSRFSNNHSSVSVRSGLLSNTEPSSVVSSSDGCERASDRHSTDPRRSPRRAPCCHAAAQCTPRTCSLIPSLSLIGRHKTTERCHWSSQSVMHWWTNFPQILAKLMALKPWQH